MHRFFCRIDFLVNPAVRSTPVAILLLLANCAPWNVPTRKLSTVGTNSPGDSAYIESQRPTGANYGCSFIEFDGKGGFLSFGQFDKALNVLNARKAQSDVLLVIYCHGWNNNAQSGDVLHFVSFLRRLSDSTSIRSKNLRVEGVYLGWRGSQYKPLVRPAEQLNDPRLREDFGGDLTDSRWDNSEIGDTILSPARYLSYWSIKNRAEFHVSRVPLARAVFTLAFKLKSPTEAANGRHHRVFVIGHSFGALLLEQAIGQASVGLITSEWNQSQRDARWPFDLIVFLNSAAPSLYAKQLGEFLQVDRKTSARPRIVSITSTGDWATGIFHPLGNWGKRFAPDLQRQYHPYGQNGTIVPAWEYYDRTPGHNPYLINHRVEPASVPIPAVEGSEDHVFALNLRPGNPENIFYTASANGKIQSWAIQDLTDPSATPEARQARQRYASNYWITTVPPEIIKDHNDVWSGPAMEMLAGLYRIVEQLSTLPPPKPPVQAMRPD